LTARRYSSTVAAEFLDARDINGTLQAAMSGSVMSPSFGTSPEPASHPGGIRDILEAIHASKASPSTVERCGIIASAGACMRPRR
jgi:hypothetical protein